ncbi:WD repeat-containing protein 44, partial [Tanacetum coccineum]
VDDNYFISGSIDGKVRIWDVHSCQVIDWIDLGDIVTAVCYNPDGKGSIVGTLDEKCSFYDIIDDRLQLHTQIFSMSKKKWQRE